MLVYCCKRLKLGMLELRHFCSNSAPHAGVVNAHRISPQRWVPAFFLLAGRLRASCLEGYIARILVPPHLNWLAGVVVVSLHSINTLQTCTNLFEKIASPLHYTVLRRRSWVRPPRRSSFAGHGPCQASVTYFLSRIMSPTGYSHDMTLRRRGICVRLSMLQYPSMKLIGREMHPV